MYTRWSIPTDRISDLPDSILCHILSFLPTKHASTTSILSKRWKPVWLSVLTLDFDHETFQDFNSFHKFVFLTMFSLRDKKISIHSFTFKCGQSSRFNQKEFNRIFKFVMHRGVENLNFNMSNKKRQIKLPARILSFNKTLRVLKLGNMQIGDFDQVNFPCVKILHLDRVTFISPQYIVKFLSGCPALEDLYTKSLVSKSSLVPMENLNALPNLVKVRICYDLNTPMTLISKAKIFYAEQSKISWTRLPMFYNLTHMELSIHDKLCDMECTSLLGILPHFPKLRHLIIQDYANENNICYNFWKLPPTVPECLSSQLKTCCIRGYKGTKHEFDFAEYIIHHSKVLETMKIQSNCLEKDQVLLKFSSYIKGGSTTCKLLFDHIDNDTYTMIF